MTMDPSVEGSRPASPMANLVLGAVLVLFVLLLGLFAAGALTRREAAEFAPTPIEALPEAKSLVMDTITIDARSEQQWRWFSFGTRSEVASPAAGWDLGFRRFNVVTARGAIDLGRVPFENITEAPSSGYTPTVFGSDTASTVLEDWYKYNFLSHLLEPQRHTFVVETRNGGHAKIAVLSYYCPKLESGCVTFVYAYQPDGSRRFSP